MKGARCYRAMIGMSVFATTMIRRREREGCYSDGARMKNGGPVVWKTHAVAGS